MHGVAEVMEMNAVQWLRIHLVSSLRDCALPCEPASNISAVMLVHSHTHTSRQGCHIFAVIHVIMGFYSQLSDRTQHQLSSLSHMHMYAKHHTHQHPATHLFLRIKASLIGDVSAGDSFFV